MQPGIEHTIDDLLVAGEVDGLHASALVDNGRGGSLLADTEARRPGGIDSADEAALLHLRCLDLFERSAERSAGILGGHCGVWGGGGGGLYGEGILDEAELSNNQNTIFLLSVTAHRRAISPRTSAILPTAATSHKSTSRLMIIFIYRHMDTQ